MFAGNAHPDLSSLVEALGRGHADDLQRLATALMPDPNTEIRLREEAGRLANVRSFLNGDIKELIASGKVQLTVGPGGAESDVENVRQALSAVFALIGTPLPLLDDGDENSL